MLKRAICVRVLLSLAVVCVAGSNMLPVKDRPFDEFILSSATRNKQEFRELVRRSQELVATQQAKSLFLALRHISDTEKIDLSKFFGQNVADIKNLSEKNRILLNFLLSSSKAKIKQGLDIKGGVSFVLQVGDAKFNDLNAGEKRAQLDKVMDIILKRVDSLGVAEPLVRNFSDNAIEIQLPGMTTKDNPELINLIKKPAKLEFRLLHATLSPQTRYDHPPLGYELLSFGGGQTSDGDEVYAFVKKLPEMTGGMVKRAGVCVGTYGEYEIALSMTDDGAKLFEKITSTNLNRRLGIVLDGKLCSAPVIRTTISNGHASISGNFSQREALELANILNNPLEIELKFLELNEIGPSLAKEAKGNAIISAAIGCSIVGLFMLVRYRIAGALALLALISNVVIVLGIMSIIGATLTLPGIAALVLTVAMAVDANILIFERMREELFLGKSMEAALEMGHAKALSSILDANLTSLLTAIVLIYFGNGPIKGFGIILAIGIIVTMFCCLVTTRGLLEAFVSSCDSRLLLPHGRSKQPRFRFLQKSRLSCYAFLIISVLSVSVTAYRCAHGNSVYSIDFTGGDEITLAFHEKIPVGDIKKIAINNGLGDVTAIYQKSVVDNSEILRIQTATGNSMKLFESLRDKFSTSRLELIKNTAVGASISHNIKWNALGSVLIAMLGMLVYIAFRFEIGYGIAAVVSTILNACLSTAIYLSLGNQISPPMIASILMVIGYAINDTIIIFDRIREELREHAGRTLQETVNLAINKTLSRTLLTSLSTFLVALVLYLFGSGVIVDVALIFLIGVAIGTLSSIFVASPIFCWYQRLRVRTISTTNSRTT